MRGSRRLCVWLGAALVAGCAHRPPALHAAPLIVERRGPGVRPFVRAKVAGESMLLLVDTGAVRSILPAKFARARGLRVGRSATDELVVDGNGRIRRMPSLFDVPVQFEGESEAGSLDFLMNEFGNVEHGILVPQDLVRRGWAVVIDLERGELRYETEEAALRRLGGAAAPLRELQFHRCLNEGLFERAHRVVATTINGVPAEMLVDTGAELTMLARNNPALPSMAASLGDRGSIHGVGSTGQGLLVERVPLVFGETSFVTPALVVPASQPCGHGALGADVLSHCTVVWGWSSLWAACRAPGGS